MSSDAFDDVLCAISRDASLDNGWAEIKTTSGSKADMETIFDAICSQYWQAVEREIAGAIVALADFEEHQPDALPGESVKRDDLSSAKLMGLLDLWNPFDVGDWPKDINRPKPDLNTIAAAVEQSVGEYFEHELISKRRARSILQALGIMDIDFVYEHRQPTFRSWGQRPQVFEEKPLLMARQCSECRRCIRSFHYYECIKGCKDSEFQRNMTNIQPKVDSDPMNELMHSLALNKLMEGKSPYRLCPPCLLSSTHPRDHLRAVRGFTKAGDRPVMEFARQLDIWEDHLDGRSLLSIGTIALDRLSMGRPLFKKTSSRHFFPGGNSHCAVMFGPLLIENGMTKHPGGALISTRNPPNLSASSSKDLMEFLAEPSEWSLDDEDEVVHKILLSVSGDRRLYKIEKPVRERRFMSTRKQMSGGLFTGHCDRFLEGEETILKVFMASAMVWTLMKSQDKTQAQHRAALKAVAERVTATIRQVYGFEIQKVLVGFADRLHKRSKLQYNRLSNNCQDFCSGMLLNDDKWDTIFNFTYPTVPADREHTADNVCLRYMMSFSEKMLDPMNEMPFVNPLVCSVPLYNSFGHNDADLIDHVTSIRLRESPNFSDGVTAFGECHDELLMKDTEFTCPKEDDIPRVPCTIADHLLDCPHDNLSVLAMHVHRRRGLYTIPSSEPCFDEFLSSKGPSAWIENRLEVLHRLLILNTYLAMISRHFQEVSKPLTTKELVKAWEPPSSYFARAWYNNKRDGRSLRRPDWSDSWDSQAGSSMMTAMVMIHTHPYMQAPDVWNSRLTAIKKRLFDESKDKTRIFDSPWTNCGCNDCLYAFAKQNCTRAYSYAATQADIPSHERRYFKRHPDYVSFAQLQSSISALGQAHPAVVILLDQLEKTPEYLEAQ
ncbi:hypothetical protein B0J14DRAFT_173520 [Halenospora varia]|nr:hypothetical protein B0J14DRAFT_173520 [Halenospora varia]